MMPHGRHIYAKVSDMENATMCAYPHSDHAIPHWKCVLCCCTDFPCFNLPDHQKNKNMRKQHSQLFFTFSTPLDVLLLMLELY